MKQAQVMPEVCLVVLLAAAGCDDVSTLKNSGPEPRPSSGHRFDAATAGTIRGRVTWTGDAPKVPRFQYHEKAAKGPQLRDRYPNPNRPIIDPAGRGVCQAIVSLHGIDPEQSRPWDHAPVRVEQRAHQIVVSQGDREASYGFVRRGEQIEMVSRDETLHLLRAGGAAFFALAFPERDQPLRRRLDEAGVVELSSGAGFFWMRAYLFVADHPYLTASQADGSFVLPLVPPGRYQVVCWLPNWQVATRERDPESSQVRRITFRPPLERVQEVLLGKGEEREVTFTLTAPE